VNIPATNGHQPNVCFCTTWEKQNKQNITFLFNAILLFDSNNAHLEHFVQISSTLVDRLFNCPVVQLLTVSIRIIGHLCKHRQGHIHRCILYALIAVLLMFCFRFQSAASWVHWYF